MRKYWLPVTLSLLLVTGGIVLLSLQTNDPERLSAKTLASQESFKTEAAAMELDDLIIESGVNKSNHEQMVLVFDPGWWQLEDSRQNYIAHELMLSWKAKCECDSPGMYFVDQDGNEVGVGTATHIRLNVQKD
ncbi:hypothetical protein SPB21_07510 [Leptothoe sp. ISB3NOV94-8A]|uniref:Uncharacterized protein n=1 Tax=Adonisia turfae CCMR0081 TaxID=2292702 RepID=A0A6M0RHR9_9CYAN|nr:hypothetical protein [Adonisia turfae]MDV3348079.1 hypothetical protein [Leptothoe sp. LEGE 181152]NEZ55413.1 hypothetical protein [Adonisia turfae CCMR0081]